MEYKDYYKTLGLKRDASPDEIKKSYRKLARKYHPDVSKEDNAEAQFKQVSEAYEVLRDPEKRSAYDQFGNDWKAGQDFRPPPNSGRGAEFHGGGFTNRDAGDFSEFFENIFGQEHGHSQQRQGGFNLRGEDAHTRILIDIEDAFLGSNPTITFTQTQGDAHGRPVVTERTLSVRIPKGVRQGQHIRLAKQGSPGIGQGEAGDLFLEIAFKPHRYYSAEGLDVYLKLPVAPWEAALGATIQAPTPIGPVKLKIPPNSKNGAKLKLKKRGIPAKAPGDLIVIIDVVLPQANTEKVKKAYQDFQDTANFNPRESIGGK